MERIEIELNRILALHNNTWTYLSPVQIELLAGAIFETPSLCAKMINIKCNYKC